MRRRGWVGSGSFGQIAFFHVALSGGIRWDDAWPGFVRFRRRAANPREGLPQRGREARSAEAEGNPPMNGDAAQ